MNGSRWIALIAVAIPIAALFAPVLFSDRSLAMRDSAHFYYPLFEWCSREWAAGRVPLWNPNESGGVPVLADGTSSVFYPGKLLLVLPLDFALLFKLYVISHIVLAAVGSYLVARAWNATRAAATVAAMSFSCGGHVVFQCCNVPFLVGAAWLPLAALFADRAIRTQSWRSAILLGMTLALMILGGDPQMAYHVVLACGLYAVLLALRRNVHMVRDIDDWQERWIGRCVSLVIDRGMHWGFSARMGLTALAAVVAILLAALQVLPSSEATESSERAAFNRPRSIYEALLVAMQPAATRQPFDETKNDSIFRGIFGRVEPNSHHEFVYDFSVGPWRLAEYVWPNVSGRMFPTHRRWLSILPAEGRVWTPTLYLGLLPVIFALAAFRFRIGNVRERWLSWLIVAFTLASFGVYGIGWLVQEVYGWLPGRDNAELGIGRATGGLYWLMVVLLPYYVYFRYPAKVLPLVAFGVSQLAAAGWDHAVLAPRPRLARLLVALGLGSLALAIAIACLNPSSIAYRVPGDPVLGPFDATSAHRDVFLAFAQTAIVSLTAFWLLRKAWRQREAREWCQGAMLLLTAAELAVANSWLVTTASAELWRSESPVAAAIREDKLQRSEDTASARVFRGNLGGWRPPSFAKESSPERLAELTQWEHDTLFPKFHLAEDVSLVESYNSIKLIDQESFLDIARRHGPRQPDGSRLPQPTALRLLGTEYLILPERQEPAFAERIETGEINGWPEDAALWRMQRTLPRAWIVHRVETLPTLPHPLRVADVHERTKAVLFPNDSARDFSRTAVVETDSPLPAWADVTDSAGESEEPCRITHHDPQRVVIEVELKLPGMLVLSDAWFPGWKAEVTSGTESREAPIYRTNRVCRGVWLSAGSHTVEFRCQPESFRRGTMISAASWVLFSIIVLVALFTRRRKP